MSDLTFGIKLTADGKQLVGEVKASREEFDKLGASVQRAAGKMASDYSGLNKTVKEHAAAVTDTDGKVGKLLDRYDPLGAKLRQLQADFKALDAAAASGKIAGRDDARVDAVYAKMRQEMEGAGAASVNLGLNTQYARREMMMLGKEALTGDFSRMPQTFASLATHSELLPALISPIGLAVAGVTAALAAGAYAWSHWETVAVESAEKTMDAIRKTLGETKRIASMSNEARDAEIADVERLIKTYEAYASHVTATTTRFNWRASRDELVKYNEKIEESKARLGELRATSDAAPAAQSIIDKTLKLDRIRAKQDEITRLDAANKKELVDTKQYLDARKVLEKELADLQAPEKAKRAKTDPNDTAVASLQAEQFRKEMDLLGVSAEQIKVYELAMRGAADTKIRDAQAAADAIAPLNAELEARKKLQKQVEDSAKGGAILGRLGGDYDAEISKKNRALNDATMSAADKQHADNLDTVAQRAAKAREELAKLGITEEARAQLLVSVDQVEAEQIRRMEELRQQVEKNNASWEYGANVALRNYRDEAANVAKQSESLFTKAFKGAEDAVTKFAMTGKLNIRDFAQTVIEEFVRINVSRPMVSAGAGMLGDLFGGFMSSMAGAPAGASASTVASFGPSPAAAGTTDFMAMLSGQRADGGPVDPNNLYRVNEKGPELLNYGGSDYLMMGGRGGYVKPLTSAGGGAPSVVVQNNIRVIEAQGTRATVEQSQNASGGMDFAIIIEQIEGGIARNVQRGTGALNGALTQSFGLNRAAGALR